MSDNNPYQAPLHTGTHKEFNRVPLPFVELAAACWWLFLILALLLPPDGPGIWKGLNWSTAIHIGVVVAGFLGIVFSLAGFAQRYWRVRR
jgi:hypothetical protein